MLRIIAGGISVRELERIDRIVNLLRVLWKKHPDQRLGQLLENYVFFQGQRGDFTSVRLFHQQDEDTEMILTKTIGVNNE